MGRARARIYFGNGEYWCGLRDKGMRKVGESDLSATALRLLHLSVAFMNNQNHARFDPDNLRRMLHRNGRPMSIQSVRAAVRELIAEGFAAPESNTRCIVVSYAYAQRDQGGVPGPCFDPAHREMSANGLLWTPELGWFNPRTGEARSVNVA